MTAKAKIFMLDNLDSFTYNLVDEFQVLGFEPIIYRNTISADYILAQMAACEEPVLLVLSPGPGEPKNAGCLMELINKAIGHYPILGICLGHQALIEHYGGDVVRAPEIVHGKASSVTHNNQGAFVDIIQPLPVARYHSLIGSNLPVELETTAFYQTDQGEKIPMAISHQRDKVIGFQFHPESILTTFGSTLLAQSINCLTQD
ncbi:anthranilate synthase component II [Thalassotalea marina]|uniref:anthranilate synthase n=1 Tax=Thalassotalea marina TaxID=1673741 RepID=A0A919BRT9_9GAMM|nr:aminodeoxychorismate/anthranilate synthase component II [Thalassotalea marina]GHG06508.1 glutamine amidotransferase [Thalassotalea marina]